MPKTTKEDKKTDEKSAKKKVTKKATVATKTTAKKVAKKETTAKKTTTKKAAASKVVKKESTKKAATTVTKKETKVEKKATAAKTVKKETTKKATTPKVTKTTKKATTEKAAISKAVKKESTKKTSTATKKATTKKTAAKKSTTTSKTKKIQSNVVAEYYDLPYRYNETVVKILYQTPTILFVYWDISDTDKDNYMKAYGEHFFYNTKPVLKIYNLTKNYSFEVEINDFANSWYINNIEPECKYKVELTRKIVNRDENLNTVNNDYIYVSSSNDIIFPNDHILLDELPSMLKFRNVKTNDTFFKNISTLRLIGINRIYNVHEFYKRFYKDDIFEETDTKRIALSSSSGSSPSSWSY